MRTATENHPRLRGRRPILATLAETKTLQLYIHGRRLLAETDFENVSIAQFAKAADTTVGPFYVRFKDKDAFLGFVSSHSFAYARQGFDRALASIKPKDKPPEALTDILLSQWSDKEFAGVVRLSVKRGMSLKKHRLALDTYRDHVVAQVSQFLPDEAKSQDRAKLEVALKAVLGILTDAVTSKSPSDALNLERYRETIIELLAKPLKKASVKPEKFKAPDDPPVTKKI